jgi:bifunctional NMN adenylyltransferase/nudix hydrolase
VTTAPLPIELAVLIGRFQPWHNGHAALLRQALTCAPKVAVVIGSSRRARSAKNPFTFDERVAMISSSLSEEEVACVSFIPMRDYFDDGRWAEHVQRAVEARAPEGAEIALVGHFKDDSSYYLNHFPQWQLVEAPREGPV